MHAITISSCEAIWNKLSPTKLLQLTEEEWKKKKSEEFYSLWQFPNCNGAIDGKHIAIHTAIQAPLDSSSPFFN